VGKLPNTGATIQLHFFNAIFIPGDKLEPIKGRSQTVPDSGLIVPLFFLHQFKKSCFSSLYLFFTEGFHNFNSKKLSRKIIYITIL